MAISKALPIARFGVDAHYHRIAGLQALDYTPHPKVQGSKGVAHVIVAAYASKAVRDAGGPSMAQRTVSIYFGAECADVIQLPSSKLIGYEVRVIDGVSHDCPVTEQIAETPIVSIKSDDPTRAELYQAVLALPEFEGAEAV